jgi:hypothetical protein
MKLISKVAAVLFASSSLVANAANSDMSRYGSMLSNKDTSVANSGYITVENFTYDIYTSFATYQPTQYRSTITLGSYGTYTDTYNYAVSFPDYGICLDIDRYYDGYNIFMDCVDTGSIVTLYDYDAKTAKQGDVPGKPFVRVIKPVKK